MEDYEQNKHTDRYTQDSQYSQNSKDKLVRYYKYGLIPILILWLILTFVTTPMSGAFFLMGFMWPYLYYTPGFEDKAQSKAYRYSFLGNIFKFQSWIFSLMGNQPKRWMVSFARLIIPLLLSGVIRILNPSWSPLWSILGWLTFEGFIWLNEKKDLQLL